MLNIKRVLCIVSSMDAGGAETFLMKMYRNIDRNKYQMDFCVNTRNEGFYDKEIRELGGRIHFVPCKSEGIIKFRRELRHLIQQENYKIVFRITSNAMGFWDLKIAKKAGAQKCIARSSNSSDGGGWKTWLSHRIGKVLFQKYLDICIAPSDLAAKYTFGEKLYQRGKVYKLNNAIDLNQYCYSVKERVNVRKELGIDENAITVGHIGRFTEQKNHFFLIKIFCEILKREKNAKLVLIGKGELQSNIKNYVDELGISKSVIFTGIRSDIPAVLSAMDLFIFPSLYEGMPNTVIEAQATGLPCLISDTITKEANITGLVKYMSLKQSAEKWGIEAIGELEKTKNREDVRKKFIEHQYDVKSVVKEFQNLIFESE